MRATIDANILFSALLKKGLTRRVLFNPEMDLYAPFFILEEFKKYQNFLLKKFSGSKKEFQTLAQTILTQISFIPDSQLKPFLPAAASLIEDKKDWLYLACALKEDTIIWSNDKGFKKQKRVKARTTSEIAKEAGML